MSKSKRFLSILLALTMIVTACSVGLIPMAVGVQPQAVTDFTSSEFRRPAPDVTLDVTDVIRVGASGDTMGGGTTIKKATPSGVPHITGAYASQAYAGETPAWPAFAFTSSVPVNIVSVAITGASTSPVLTAGGLNNTTSAGWEIRGGTANAGNTMKIAITYTYVWTSPYTGVDVTDTYVTNGYSYVEDVIFPAGVWAFPSAYGNVRNAADVQYVSRLLGRGVYGNTIASQANSSNEYSAGYFDFSSNSPIHDGDTTIPKKTMLIADPPHKNQGDQYIADGQGTYADGDSRRAKSTVYLDTSVQSLQSNNFRMHFFIHGSSRSTNSDRDLTYETIHVRDGDVAYTGATGNVLGASNAGALAALNPTGPVDGTIATGDLYINQGMETQSTLYGTGASGNYTLVTQWTARGDKPPVLAANWMQYYHAVTIEIVSVTKAALRSALAGTIGIATKTMTGANDVTTIVSTNGSDPLNGGIANTNKGKNPQSWYYSAGWVFFSNSYDGAWKSMHQPSASQTQINDSANQLNGYYSSLVLAGGNYSNRTSQTLSTGMGNTFYNSTVSPLNTIIDAVENADTNFSPKLRNWQAGQYGYYTLASRTALENAYNAAIAAKSENYNVLYQPYIDYCAKQLQTAVNNLVFKNNTVSFDSNGGTGTMAAQSMEAGTTINLTANAFTKSGYTFTGWATTAQGVMVFENNSSFAMGENNVTLYAKWSANNYNVVYNGNGSTGGTTIGSEHIYDTPKALNNNGFTKTGYTFTGWGTSPTDTVPLYLNQQSVSNLIALPQASLTLYAVWAPAIYNIVFNANGGVGTMSNQPIAYLSNASLNVNNFSLTGKAFKGWATTQGNADVGIVAYADGAVFNMSTPQDKTLYAVWDAGTYVITFHPNAAGVSGVMSAQNLPFGQTANLNVNTFTRTGYIFLGWANTPTGTTAFNNGASYTMNTQGAELYAKWAPIVYSVSYNANGGASAPAPNAAVYDVEFIIPSAEPLRSGYTFLGWARTASAGTFEFVTGESVSNLSVNNGETVVLYAIWVPNSNTTYKVEHYRENLIGSYTLYETTTQIGTTAAVGVAVYKTYQGFNSNTTHPSTFSSGLIIGNGSLVLRIYYNRTNYLVSFNTNGGSSVTAISGKYGTSIVPPTNPVKAGYTFNGWSPLLPSTIPAGNLTVTAQWSANPYNVVFNGNGATSGTMPSQSILFASSATLSNNSFIRGGYSFVGWSTTPAGGKEYENADTFTMQTTGATLYAVWAPAAGTEFKVEQYLQSISGLTYSLGHTTTHTGTTGGLGLAQWQEIPGFTSNPGHAGNVFAGIITGDGNLTLRLYYTRNSYTITFSGVGGIDPITTKFGESITAPTAPTKIGFHLAGWSKNEQLTDIVDWPYQMEASNSTFYIKWAPNNYVVSFDPAGGKINNIGGIQNSSVSYSATYEEGTLGFPIPVLTGYTFNGWFTTNDVPIYGDTVVQITAAQTLTASWSINSYTVNFDLNGGVGAPPQSVTGVFATPIMLPTSGYSNVNPGHTFLGWNTTADATAPLSSFAIPEDGATLYAVWRARNYTVSFNLNGGSGTVPPSITAGFGTSIDVSMTGYTKAGYTFGGWATTADGVLADQLENYTVQAGNTTLYAIWVPNSHTITLFSNGGDGLTSVQIQTQVDANVDLSEYNAYSKVGHTFVGWNTSQAATTGFWSYQVPATSTTLLFAIYTPGSNTTVSFSLNGGSGSAPSDQIGEFGSTVLLPAQGDISRQHYDFLGWATSPSASSPLSTYAFPSTNATLYAVWSRIPVSLTAKNATSTVIDQNKGFIYGLDEGISESVFLNDRVQILGDGELRVTYYADAFGTGTKVELIDRLTSTVLETYYVVIFGDVDGDGFITADDVEIIRQISSYQSSFTADSAFEFAADLSGDGTIDAFDLNLITAALHGIMIVDQTGRG
ncbi:MAG TPA: InlB B-repeat-containing protein [Clostridia bacterium]|nr:InlB B-repeat-containing protein [Clostridia bacterium]